MLRGRTSRTSEHVLLAFDLASNTGWAVRDERGRITFGSHRMAPPRSQPNVLFPAANKWLADKLDEVRPSVLVCETWGHLQGKAVQILWGLNGILMSHCEDLAVIPLAAREWKKLGFGCATLKVTELKKVARAHGHMVEDHDAAAAVGMLLAAEKKLTGII